MTIPIKSDCALCGPHTVPPAAIRIVNTPDPWCTYRCRCGEQKTKPLTVTLVAELLLAGVAVVELPEPRGACDDEPLTEDDLIAFGLMLEAGGNA